MCSRAGRSSRSIRPACSQSSYGLGGGQLGLDLVVLDDPALGGVDQEHPARLEPALGDHRGRVEVEDAGLAAEHDQAVFGAPPAARAQAVAVEHRADQRAVGERDAGRAVPGLHQAGVEAVERPAGRVHRGVVLPRLRDHHQHGVRQVAAGEVEQLEHLVEVGRVGRGRRADREEPADVARQLRRGQQRLAGVHPVLVAADRVDLAVVRDEAVRVGQRPRRERVRREPRVDQGDRAAYPAVGQVREERGQLVGREHALVDHGAGGQAREVGRYAPLGRLPLGLLAHAERDPVEVEAADRGAGRAVGPVVQAVRGEEHLADPRPDQLGGRAEAVRLDRHVAPAEHLGALDDRVLLDHRDRLGGLGVLGGQEDEAGGVEAGRRQGEVDVGPEELVGHLDHDAGAVAGVGLRAPGAPVVEPDERREPLRHDVVRATAGQVGDERDATGVALELRVVQALGMRLSAPTYATGPPRSSLVALISGSGRRRPCWVF